VSLLAAILHLRSDERFWIGLRLENPPGERCLPLSCTPFAQTQRVDKNNGNAIWIKNTDFHSANLVRPFHLLLHPFPRSQFGQGKFSALAETKGAGNPARISHTSLRMEACLHPDANATTLRLYLCSSPCSLLLLLLLLCAATLLLLLVYCYSLLLLLALLLLLLLQPSSWNWRQGESRLAQRTIWLQSSW
jgi:hypothetical protein